MDDLERQRREETIVKEAQHSRVGVGCWVLVCVGW